MTLKNFLLGNTSSLFAVISSCVGTILTMFCCLFFSGIAQLCFAHFESSLLSERFGCRQGAADMLKARWPKSTWWLSLMLVQGISLPRPIHCILFRPLKFSLGLGSKLQLQPVPPLRWTWTVFPSRLLIGKNLGTLQKQLSFLLFLSVAQ